MAPSSEIEYRGPPTPAELAAEADLLKAEQALRAEEDAALAAFRLSGIVIYRQAVWDRLTHNWKAGFQKDGRTRYAHPSPGQVAVRQAQDRYDAVMTAAREDFFRDR